MNGGTYQCVYVCVCVDVVKTLWNFLRMGFHSVGEATQALTLLSWLPSTRMEPLVDVFLVLAFNPPTRFYYTQSNHGLPSSSVPWLSHSQSWQRRPNVLAILSAVLAKDLVVARRK
eukprot:GFYU01000230.1.p1 GENE.GFYU01000230.1~~GFYU01000230.1.p1  ORF type:complete len:116 (-),score=7.15 GFYU01000230.1:114-461(-)